MVASRARGRGHARPLYLDLFEQARQAGHERVVCEVSATLPNPASAAFHADLGFAQVGTGSLDDDRKAVSYLALRLTRGLPQTV